MFLDEAVIYVKGGNGGDGCISFRREKYVPKGGPNGGTGGKGGDVIFRVNKEINTLLDISSTAKYYAENGRPGEGSNKTGRQGKDLIMEIPKGTIVKDRETGYILKDFTNDNDLLVIAKGGKGGKGNKSFATSTNRTPRIAQDGRTGEERRLKLELKLIADVGLIGLPNAGKSTLLSRLSNAHPKIADYPFTTRHPQLGVVNLYDFSRFVVADIPGLIEGAHKGAGLGDEFLRHIERTKILVHLLDILPVDGSNPVDSYHTIRNELRLFNPNLFDKKEIVVANKTDLLDEPSVIAKINLIEDQLSKKIFPISAVTGKNIPQLINEINAQLSEID
mgnify:CR=1 FL=1